MKSTYSQTETNTRTSAWLSLFATVAIGWLLTACDKSPALVPLDSVKVESTVNYNVQVNFCGPAPAPQKQYLKTIVIFDHSGSNAENYKMAADGTGAPDLSSGTIVISPTYATDPQGLTRYGTPTTPGTLLNYLNTLAPNDPTDPTRFFALVDFSDSATTYPSGSSGFTSDINGFYNYVYTDAGTATGGAPHDSGGTSYLSALNAAYNIMNNDIQAEEACAAQLTTAAPTASCPRPGQVSPSSYVIVFMSDGSPIINISGVGVGPNGQIVVTGQITLTKESTTDILGKVAQIVDLQSNDRFVDSVNMFTIYYYSPGNVDQSGQTLLAQMAKAGNGIGYNALSGTNINYNSFQPPQKTLQYNLSDVFVTNANAVWWTDGKLHQDTDGDGLPDDVEVAFGTDPTKVSTANNGVSDLVRYQLAQGAACQNMGANGICQDPVTNYSTGLCNGISSSNIKGVFTYKSSDPDGLNDCEKILMSNQGGIGTPDSNQDNIPDWLEFVNNVPFQLGTTPAVTTPQQDGYTIYQKIKYSLPVSIPTNEVVNLSPSVYNLSTIVPTSNSQQTCYQLTVSNLPMASSTNQVRVDVSFKSNLMKESYLYYVGKKAFAPNSTSLQINDWNDATEITNKTWSQWP